MTNLTPPKIYFFGDERHEAGYLSNICIDYSSKKIRGTIKVKPEHNHPNIKKKNQINFYWFSFDSKDINIEENLSAELADFDRKGTE